MTDQKFGEDLLQEPDFVYDHVAEMAARGFPLCKHCEKDFCVAEEFYVNFLQDWQEGAKEDIVLGDGTTPPLENNAIRKYLYRQFLFHSEWRPLKKNVRVVLPACATLLIRKEYPGKHNAYMGHRWKAATEEKTHAIDQDGKQHESLYWIYQEGTWVLTMPTDNTTA